MSDEKTTECGSCARRKPSSIRLDRLDLDNEMCVYCACGRIVTLDRSEMQLKLSLGKELQCTTCRNRRISEEIDFLNNLYDGLIDEESY